MSEQIGNESVEDVSAAFDLLSDARRRGVLYTVKHNGRTPVKELARRIAAWQSEEQSSTTDPSTVETSLVHAHLPKLADAGVIEYDRENEAVEPTTSTAKLEPFLECTREREFTLLHAARTSNLDRLGEVQQ